MHTGLRASGTQEWKTVKMDLINGARGNCIGLAPQLSSHLIVALLSIKDSIKALGRVWVKFVVRQGQSPTLVGFGGCWDEEAESEGPELVACCRLHVAELLPSSCTLFVIASALIC